MIPQPVADTEELEACIAAHGDASCPGEWCRAKLSYLRADGTPVEVVEVEAEVSPALRVLEPAASLP